jgi:hypothetical protein
MPPRCNARRSAICNSCDVTLFQFLFSKRSKADWQSWWAMLITLPWVFLIVFLLAGSRHNATIAARQQMTIGTITGHEASNHNQYRYTFTFSGRQYSGLSQSPTDTAEIGEPMTVFFDPRNPDTNSLEDFSAASKRNGNMLPLLFLGVAGVAGLIAFSKARNRKRTTMEHL